MLCSRRSLRLVVVLALAPAALRANAQAPAAESSAPLARASAAYSRGDRDAAVSLLADAIRSDPHDPRPYYLRALCLARAGRPVEARADLVVAAALEARQPDHYPVDESLTQLSRRDRTLLNQFRWRAQHEDFARAFDAGLIAFAERPVPAVRSDAAVLRQKVSVPLGSLTESKSLHQLADVAARQPATLAVETGSNPFSDDIGPVEELPAQAPVEAATDADPFGDPAAAPAAAETDAPHAQPADPFAGEAEIDRPAHNANGKLSSTKLLGILGRAVARAAPVPALGRVRQQLPDLPLPIPGGQPPGLPGEAAAATPDPFGSDVQPTGFTDEGEFGAEPAAGELAPGEPAPASAEPTDVDQPAAEGAQPAEAPAEDPFG